MKSAGIHKCDLVVHKKMKINGVIAEVNMAAHYLSFGMTSFSQPWVSNRKSRLTNGQDSNSATTTRLCCPAIEFTLELWNRKLVYVVAAAAPAITAFGLTKMFMGLRSGHLNLLITLPRNVVLIPLSIIWLHNASLKWILLKTDQTDTEKMISCQITVSGQTLPNRRPYF